MMLLESHAYLTDLDFLVGHRKDTKTEWLEIIHRRWECDDVHLMQEEEAALICSTSQASTAKGAQCQ